MCSSFGDLRARPPPPTPPPPGGGGRGGGFLFSLFLVCFFILTSFLCCWLCIKLFVSFFLFSVFFFFVGGGWGPPPPGRGGGGSGWRGDRDGSGRDPECQGDTHQRAGKSAAAAPNPGVTPENHGVRRRREHITGAHLGLGESRKSRHRLVPGDAMGGYREWSTSVKEYHLGWWATPPTSRLPPPPRAHPRPPQPSPHTLHP